MNVCLTRKGVRAVSMLPSLSRVRTILNAVLRSEKKQVRGDLNVVFVDNATIRRIHKKFLNDNSVTDVIAFPYASEQVFGDIFVSIPMARANAKEFHQDPSRELIRLIIHGFLHLLGYDDHRPSDRKKMWACQELFVDRYAPQ